MTYYNFEEFVSSAKLNKHVEMALKGTAEQANKILKAVGSYENNNLTAAENYTVASGIQNTVDNSDLITPKTELTLSNEVIINTGSLSNEANAFDGSDGTSASGDPGNGTFYFGKTFDAIDVFYVSINISMSNSGDQQGATLQTYNGSSWTDLIGLATADNGSETFDGELYINQNIQGVRIKFINGGTPAMNINVFDLRFFGNEINQSGTFSNGSYILGNSRGVVEFNPIMTSDNTQAANFYQGGTINTKGFFDKVFVTGGSSTANSVTISILKNGVTVATKSVGLDSNGENSTLAVFEPENYSEFFDPGDTFQINSNQNLSARSARTYNGTHFSYASSNDLADFRGVADGSSISYTTLTQQSTSKIQCKNVLEIKDENNIVSLYSDDDLPVRNLVNINQTIINTPVIKGGTTTETAGIKCTANENIRIFGGSSYSGKPITFRNNSNQIVETPFIALQGETFYATVDSVSDFQAYGETATFPVSFSHFDVIGSGTSTVNGQYNFTTTVDLYEIVSLNTSTVDLDETDTSLTADLTDGTNTVSGITFTNKHSGPVDISSLDKTNMNIIWNLNTTDATVTPKQNGWGVYLI